MAASDRTGGEAAGAPARAGARSNSCGCVRQPGQYCGYRVYIARCGTGCPRDGTAIQVVRAGTSREIDAAFATFQRERPDALFVGDDPFLNSRRPQLSLLAMRQRDSDLKRRSGNRKRDRQRHGTFAVGCRLRRPLAVFQPTCRHSEVRAETLKPTRIKCCWITEPTRFAHGSRRHVAKTDGALREIWMGRAKAALRRTAGLDRG